MRKSLDQNNMICIQKKLKIYYQTRHSYIKVDVFDFAVIFENAMILFLHVEFQ